MTYLNEAGHLALWLAFALAVCGAVLPAFYVYRRQTGSAVLTARLTQGLFALSTFAFLALMAAYIRSDFSLMNVSANSHTAKPLLYKISGTWGNHEGSLLLWLFVLTGFGAAISFARKKMDWGLWSLTLATQNLVGLGFLSFILFTSNPFQRLLPAPLDGKGLNPLLQDPGLAFHPPLLYVGYVGLSTAFSFAIAALIQGRVDPAWARWVRPWVLIAWCALTAGIALGSWWAYYELGWGGFWFWDPVENASLMPWFFATALLHCIVVVEKRDSLKVWTIMLAILGFSFSLLGTFLVRSGIITSVHTFASDPTRGVFILVLLVMAIGGALLLFAVRAHAMENGNRVNLISREGAMLVNNFFLSAAALTVLVGTLFPLVLELLTGAKISVGPPYFNATVLPLIGLMALLMGVAPLMTWRQARLKSKSRGLGISLIAACIASTLFLYAFAPKFGVSFAALLIGVWLICAAFLDLWDKTGKTGTGVSTRLKRLIRLPKRVFGTNLAHAGFGVMAIGIVGASAWFHEELRILNFGDEVSVGPYTLVFEDAAVVQGPNYKALRSQFRPVGEERILTPETRFFTDPPMQTTEAAILTRLSGDLFVAVSPPDSLIGDGTVKTDGVLSENAFLARFYYRPLQAWMWLGAALMILGGMFAVSTGRKRT